MATIPTLTTGRLVLRPFREDDAPAVQRLLSTPDIAEQTLRIPYPYPAGAAIEWIRTHPQLAAESGHILWAIVLPDDTVIGSIGIGRRSDPPGGVLGYWLGVEHWGNGYMTEAVRAVIQFGIVRLGLNRVEALCFTTNPASARVLEKAGMTYEGRHPEPVMKNGTPRELLRYAISRPSRKPES